MKSGETARIYGSERPDALSEDNEMGVLDFANTTNGGVPADKTSANKTRIAE